MALQLDTRRRLLWRDPFTVQFGSGPGSPVLHEIGDAEAKLLRALQLGFAPSALGLVCAEIGLEQKRARSLLQQLTPVLRGAAAHASDDAAAPPPFGVLVEGPGPGRDSGAASRLAYEVRALGWHGAPARLAVLVGAHALAPERVIHWQGSSLPQLPVLFDDDGVVIGPLLTADGPCLRCLERHRLEADPCWPALASQLLGQPAQGETGVLLVEAVAVLCRILAGLAESAGSAERTGRQEPGGADGLGKPPEAAGSAAALLPAGRALRIGLGGERRHLELGQHPECGCRLLAGIDRHALAEPQLVQEP